MQDEVILSDDEIHYLETRFKKSKIRLKSKITVDSFVISWLKTANHQQNMFLEVIGFLPKRKYIHESNRK